MPKKTTEKVKAETTLKTIVQVNGKDIDVSTIAADALKQLRIKAKDQCTMSATVTLQ